VSVESPARTDTRRAPIRVLIVDDAAFMVKAVTEILSEDPMIEVVGSARNGSQALELIGTLRPDVITLDIDMPVMDGIRTVRHVMIESPVPVVVLSSLFRDGAITFEALRLGVVDFLAKPSGAISQDIHRAKQQLIDRVKIAAEVHIERVRRVKLHHWSAREAMEKRYGFRTLDYLLALGTTLGGPNTSIRLLMRLPPDLPAAVVLVQEISPQILPAFVKKFDEHVPWRMVEATDGAVLEQGCCYVGSTDTTVTVALNDRREPCLEVGEAIELPLNQLFISAARVFERNTIGLLLTGLGGDGADGFAEIRRLGGTTLAEDAQCCVYPNLTEYAIRSGVVDRVIDEKRLGETISALVSEERGAADTPNQGSQT